MPRFIFSQGESHKADGQGKAGDGLGDVKVVAAFDAGPGRAVRSGFAVGCGCRAVVCAVCGLACAVALNRGVLIGQGIRGEFIRLEGETTAHQGGGGVVPPHHCEHG